MTEFAQYGCADFATILLDLASRRGGCTIQKIMGAGPPILDRPPSEVMSALSAEADRTALLELGLKIQDVELNT